MYAFPTTPTAAANTARGATSNSRRSTRSARGSAKRRRADGPSRGGGGPRSRLVQKGTTFGGTRKWVQVQRAPAKHIRFAVPTWVLFEKLTSEERAEYEREQKRLLLEKEEQEEAASNAVEGSIETNHQQEITAEDKKTATENSPIQESSESTNSMDITPSRESSSTSREAMSGPAVDSTSSGSANALDEVMPTSIDEPSATRVRVEAHLSTETLSPSAVRKEVVKPTATQDTVQQDN